MFIENVSRADDVKHTVHFEALYISVCVYASARGSLCLLQWETIYPPWYQEKLAPHTKPAEQVRFRHILWTLKMQKKVTDFY